MAKSVLTNAGIYIGGYELSGYSNAVQLQGGPDILDVTGFGSTGYREYIAGLMANNFSVAGFNDWANVDAVLFDKIGDTDEVLTLCETNATGGVSFFMRGVEGTYNAGMAIGQAASFEMAGSVSTGPIVRGTVMHRATAAASSANGTGYQLGALASTKSLYGALHVFSISGTNTPTLGVKIQSDDNSGFTSATDRLTFTNATAIGSEWKSASPGAISDDYWRAVLTISGTNPSFGLIVSFGFA